MTARERSEICVLIELVAEVKEELGELRAEVRNLQAGRPSLRNAVLTITAAVIGAAGYVAHTFFGLGRSN